MFAGIGSGALVVISLVIVACVKKSRSAPLQGKYISIYPCVKDLYHFTTMKNDVSVLHDKIIKFFRWRQDQFRRR